VTPKMIELKNQLLILWFGEISYFRSLLNRHFKKRNEEEGQELKRGCLAL
jgi:hypothetical protein